MNKILKNRILIALLALMIIFVVVISTLSVTSKNNGAYAYSLPGTYERTPEEDADYHYYTTQLLIQDYFNTKYEQEDKAKQEKLKKDKKEKDDACKKVAQQLGKSIDTLRKGAAGDGIDGLGTFDAIMDLASTVCSAFSMVIPYGAVISEVLDLAKGIVDMCMSAGAVPAKSELELLEDRLNRQFDEVKNQLSGIENQINDISEQISNSTNKILDGMKNIVDANEAKQKVMRFFITGEGNFSYNQFRNYIYGTTDPEKNIYNSQAYYGKLKDSISQKESQDSIRKNYDKLYDALTSIGVGVMGNSSILTFYDYLGIGAGNSVVQKSIVQDYYDFVSAYRYLLPEGRTPEIDALDFAFDLYRTAIMADSIILECNNFQYIQIYKESFISQKNPEECVYELNNSSTKVSLDDINKMEKSVAARAEELNKQIACDVAYILNMGKSYSVQTQGGDVYYIVENANDKSPFAQLAVNQTVYLNAFSDVVCERFGLEKTAFSYEVDGEKNPGIFTANNNNPKKAVLKYEDKEVYSINFTVGRTNTFSGGSGTVSDPYLISYPDQLDLIRNGLDKHYRLTNNLMCNGKHLDTIGWYVNSNNNDVCEAFTGSLDGNGYSINNLQISGGKFQVGLFGELSGTVKNLTVNGFSVESKPGDPKDQNNYYYAGTIAGVNYGTIYNCRINNSTVNLAFKAFEQEEKTADGNRNINVFSGGVVGKNIGNISHVIVSGGTVNGDSKIFIGGQPREKNKNNVYVGGVCGSNSRVLEYVLVQSATVDSKAYTTARVAGSIRPYVTVQSGGLAGKSEGKDIRVENVCVLSTDCTTAKKSELRKNLGSGVSYEPNLTTETDQYVVGMIDSRLSSFYPSIFRDGLKFYTLVSSKVIVDNMPALKHSGEYAVTFDYIDDGENVTAEMMKYKAGEEEFRTEGLNFYVNGQKIDYRVVAVYGFDTRNKSLTKEMISEITVLIMAKIDGEDVLLSKKMGNIIVGKNYLIDLEITGVPNEYVRSEGFRSTNVFVEFFYAVEFDEEDTDRSDKINYGAKWSDFRHPFPSTGVKFADTNDTYNFGPQIWQFTYGDFTKTFDVTVICGHDKNFIDSDDFVKVPIDATNELYNSLSEDTEDTKGDRPRMSTCTDFGWDTYICKECNNVQKVYYSKLPHELERKPGKAATCIDEGLSASIGCKNCIYIETQSIPIPRTPHEYDHNILKDGTQHECKTCGVSENHQYQVTEEVRQKSGGYDIAYELVYRYTCSCGYSYEDVDNNFIVAENADLPTVIVTNGYALENSEKEVVIYVQLVNNPGITGANFSIRYDSRLTLVGEPQDGGLLANSLLKDQCATAYGYNFVWANNTNNLCDNDGNLLKLTFRIPENAEVNTEYPISVVYDITEVIGGSNGISGGFVGENGKKQFITKDGFIKVVDKLPGDVNSDGKVDMLDAILMGRRLVGVVGVDIDYDCADVNLDGVYGDIEDMVVILQYITGSYGSRILPRDFKIKLNANGYEGELPKEYLSVTHGGYYSEAASATDVAEIIRSGYKFLGWSYKMYTRNPGDFVDLINGEVEYNPDQKYQTLYAQWELNEIVFDMNGSTDVAIEIKSYSSATTADNIVTLGDCKLQREMRIVQVDGSAPTVGAYLLYRLNVWQLNKEVDGLKNSYSITEMINLATPGIGRITLKILWDDGHFVDENGDDLTMTSRLWDINTNRENKGYLDNYLSKTGYAGFELYSDAACSDPYRVYRQEADYVTKENLSAINNINGRDNWSGNYIYVKDDYTFANGGPEGDKLYVKYIPLKYTLKFDAEYNDGLLESEKKTRECSIEAPYVFNQKWTISKDNFEYLGWEYEENGTINKLRVDKFTEYTLPYIDPVKEEDGKYYVKLHAVWRSKLLFNAAGDTVIGLGDYEWNEIEIPSTYRKDLDSVAIPVIAIAANAFNADAATDASINDKIKQIAGMSIPKGITTIGESAFLGCINIHSIIIPDSVISIGANAFKNCNNLETVSIGTGVTAIPDYAFDSCSKLTRIDIPYGVESIGHDSFARCSKLNKVIIGNSVTSIGIGAFWDCVELSDLTIPNSIENIGKGAFGGECNNITTATMPISVLDSISISKLQISKLQTLVLTDGENIGQSAFSECSELSSVTIPASMKSINNSAFEGCTKLQAVYITDLAKWCGINFYNHFSNPLYYAHNLYLNGELVEDLIIPEELTSISTNAFRECSGLTSVTIGKNIERIGNDAFRGCTNIETVNWNATSCTTTGCYEYPIFNVCEKISTVNIGENVTSIPMYAFLKCSGITNVTISDSVTNIGDGAFEGCDNITMATMPTIAIASIPKSSLQNAIITSGTSISANAFKNSSKLTSVTIPNSVTSIGSSAFSGCSALKAVYINDVANWCKMSFGGETANPLYYAHNLYLNGALVTNLIIPDSVTNINNYAFYRCLGFISVTIGNNVSNIGNFAFYDCCNLRFVTMQDRVGRIGDYAFQNCSMLLEITLSANLIEIGSGAFQNCISLTNITLPDRVMRISSGAFYNCSGLKNITLSNRLSEIGDSAFYGCIGLSSITIPRSVAGIGLYAFWDCSILTIYCERNTRPSGWVYNWNYFGKYERCRVIWNCLYNDEDEYGYVHSEIDGITYQLKDGVATIYKRTGNISGEITIPSTITHNNQAYSVTSIVDSAFSGCSGLTSITLPSSITNIGNFAFSGCSGLTSITLPSSITNIGNSAFSGCSSLTSIDVPDGIGSIGNYAFDSCSGLTTVNWYASSCRIGGTSASSSACSIFSNCPNLSTAYIGNNVTCIVSGLFNGCSGLRRVTIPNTVTSIESFAFMGCTSLSDITLPDSLTEIGFDAFYGCSSLTNIRIPDGVTSIHGFAFSGTPWYSTWYDSQPDGLVYIGKVLYGYKGNMPANTSITIRNDINDIGDWAFSGCSGLTSITIPSNVIRIGQSAFSGCNGLTSIIYRGTKAQWNEISKYVSWNSQTGNYTIYCTDGTIAK